MEGAVKLERIRNIIPHIQSIAQCGFVLEAFNALLDHDCENMGESTYNLAMSALLAAGGLTLGAFFFCACIRCVPKVLRLHSQQAYTRLRNT
jgi:hypothetical protein